MVSETKDMLDKANAKPSGPNTAGRPVRRRVRLAREIAENGEAILQLTNGETVEVHGHDAHFYVDKGTIMTEHEDEEMWIFAEEIISVSRH